MEMARRLPAVQPWRRGQRREHQQRTVAHRRCEVWSTPLWQSHPRQPVPSCSPPGARRSSGGSTREQQQMAAKGGEQHERGGGRGRAAHGSAWFVCLAEENEPQQGQARRTSVANRRRPICLPPKRDRPPRASPQLADVGHWPATMICRMDCRACWHRLDPCSRRPAVNPPT